VIRTLKDRPCLISRPRISPFTRKKTKKFKKQKGGSLGCVLKKRVDGARGGGTTRSQHKREKGGWETEAYSKILGDTEGHREGSKKGSSLNKQLSLKKILFPLGGEEGGGCGSVDESGQRGETWKTTVR